MKPVLSIIHLVLSLLLIVLILVQTRGTGFSRSFTNSAASFTRRGLEKVVFKLTIVVCAVFIIISIALLLV